jgi:3-methylcrotonyl-CoA carboxylase alpha subunit
MPWDIRDGFRSNAMPVRKVAVSVGSDADWFDPADHDVDADTPLPFVTDLSPRRFAVTTGGDTVLVEVPDYDADVEAVLGGDSVSAPMPGKLLSLHVKAGDTVAKGDPVAVMEAMKMEHTLPAPRDGVVASVEAAPGDQVSEGDILVHLEAE